jgi:hypothetical protein
MDGNNHHTSPLMAEEGEATTLGAHNNIIIAALQEDDDHQSPLERLIARSTIEQQQHGSGGGGVDMMMRRDDSVFGGGGILNDGSNNEAARRPNHQHHESKPSVLTLCALTGCLLQVGFVWSSFMAPSWFDTHLLLSVSLHIINKDTDQLLHSTSLASLLSDMNGADEGMAAMFLIVTSLVLPCLFSVLGFVWTVQDRNEQDQLLQSSASLVLLARWRREHNVWYSPRRCLEYCMRISLCIFFLLCIMDIGTSSIEMNNNNTQFTLINQMQGGLACYTVGMASALVVIVLLRISETACYDHCRSLLLQNDDASRRSAPPHQAFQFLPWNMLPGTTTTVTEAQEELEAPLLLGNWDVSNNNNNNSSNNAGAPTTPLQDHAVESMQIETRQDSSASEANEVAGLACWKRALLYELAIGATVFWIPALFLPLFELSYGGIISDFMTEETFLVRFWEFPAVLWQRGIAAGTEQWVLVLLGLVLVSLVYIIPLLTTLLAIGTWILDPIPSEYCSKVLGALQPCLCGIIFYLALHFAIPSFEIITEYAIDMGSSGLCKRFEVITSDTCLTIVGDSQAGLWCLLAQSLSLELLVALTLLWKRR